MSSVNIVHIRSLSKDKTVHTALFMVDNVLLVTCISKYFIDSMTYYDYCTRPVNFSELYYNPKKEPITKGKLDINNKPLINHLTQAKSLLLKNVKSLTEYINLSNRFIVGEIEYTEWIKPASDLCT